MPLYRGSRRLILQRRVAAVASGLDAATTAWISAVTGAGGAVSGTQQSRVDTLIKALKTDGSGNLFNIGDRLYLHAGESDAKQATISVINPGASAAVPTGSITLSAGGYTGDGSTGYLDTLFIPSTAGGHFAQDSASLATYVNSKGFNTWIGTQNTAGSSYAYLTAGSFGAELNDAAFPTATLNTTGLWLVSRIVSGGWKLYNNSTLSQDNSSAATSSSLPNQKIFISASPNSVGTPGNFNSDPIKASWIGGGLTASQATAVSNIINTYMTSWGVNTY